MIGDIRVAVNELLTEVDWMDEKTKLRAMEKVRVSHSENNCIL